MDYTKTKTFIAFINKDTKDKFWINGNLTNDKDEPRIYPYETKEEKELALYIGKNLGCWSETADVEGVLLKVTGNPFHIINKKEAKERLKLLEKESQARAEKRKELEKAKKAEPEVVEQIIPVKVEKPKAVKVEKVEIPKVEPPKRGRPRKNIFEE